MEKGTKSKTSRYTCLDLAAPKSLHNLQSWFAKIITQPLQEDQKIAKTSPFATPIEEEAAKHIVPTRHLKSFQRLEIYHQQYWWRLLNCLQENFPTLVRLFGYNSFNKQIATPYLSSYPPSHWALSRLGNRLSFWIQSSYFEKDRELVLAIAEMDVAVNQAFWAKESKPVNFQHLDESKILSKNLKLQKHVHLFQLKADLFSFRECLLKESVAYWGQNPFPELLFGTFYFVLYRGLCKQVKWKEITAAEYQMLSYFRQKTTIEQACEKMESAHFAHAEANLALWFREWTYLKWFGEI